METQFQRNNNILLNNIISVLAAVGLVFSFRYKLYCTPTYPLAEVITVAAALVVYLVLWITVMLRSGERVLVKYASVCFTLLVVIIPFAIMTNVRDIHRTLFSGVLIFLLVNILLRKTKFNIRAIIGHERYMQLFLLPLLAFSVANQVEKMINSNFPQYLCIK